MPKIVLIVAGLASLAALAGIGWSFPPAAAQQSLNACHSYCSSTRATCDRGCNAGGGSFLHRQACFTDCERGYNGCMHRCLRR